MNEREKYIRAQAITVLELTKGFTPEQWELMDNGVKTAEELANYILELTNKE